MLWGLFATRAATGTEAGGGRLLHPGFVDLASVSVSARLMGALAGGHLEAQPVRVARLDRCLRQVRAAGPAAVPRHKGVVHLCNQIHAKILAQGYDHLLLKSTAKLSTMMLSYIKKTSFAVVYPRLKMVGSSFSIILRSLAILMIVQRSSVRLISCHVLARPSGDSPAPAPLAALCAQAEAPARIVRSPHPVRIARFDPLDEFDEFVSGWHWHVRGPVGRFQEVP